MKKSKGRAHARKRKDPGDIEAKAKAKAEESAALGQAAQRKSTANPTQYMYNTPTNFLERLCKSSKMKRSLVEVRDVAI